MSDGRDPPRTTDGSGNDTAAAAAATATAAGGGGGATATAAPPASSVATTTTTTNTNTGAAAAAASNNTTVTKTTTNNVDAGVVAWKGQTEVGPNLSQPIINVVRAIEKQKNQTNNNLNGLVPTTTKSKKTTTTTTTTMESKPETPSVDHQQDQHNNMLLCEEQMEPLSVDVTVSPPSLLPISTADANTKSNPKPDNKPSIVTHPAVSPQPGHRDRGGSLPPLQQQQQQKQQQQNHTSNQTAPHPPGQQQQQLQSLRIHHAPKTATTAATTTTTAAATTAAAAAAAATTAADAIRANMQISPTPSSTTTPTEQSAPEPSAAPSSAAIGVPLPTNQTQPAVVPTVLAKTTEQRAPFPTIHPRGDGDDASKAASSSAAAAAALVAPIPTTARATGIPIPMATANQRDPVQQQQHVPTRHNAALVAPTTTSQQSVSLPLQALAPARVQSSYPAPSSHRIASVPSAVSAAPVQNEHCMPALLPKLNNAHAQQQQHSSIHRIEFESSQYYPRILVTINASTVAPQSETDGSPVLSKPAHTAKFPLEQRLRDSAIIAVDQQHQQQPMVECKNEPARSFPPPSLRDASHPSQKKVNESPDSGAVGGDRPEATKTSAAGLSSSTKESKSVSSCASKSGVKDESSLDKKKASPKQLSDVARTLLRKNRKYNRIKAAKRLAKSSSSSDRKRRRTIQTPKVFVEGLTYDWTSLKVNGAAAWNKYLNDRRLENPEDASSVPVQSHRVTPMDTYRLVQNLNESLETIQPPDNSPLYDLDSSILNRQRMPTDNPALFYRSIPLSILEKCPNDMKVLLPELANIYGDMIDHDICAAKLVGTSKRQRSYQYMTATEVREHIRAAEKEAATLTSLKDKVFCTSKQLGLPDKSCREDRSDTTKDSKEKPVFWQQDFAALLTKDNDSATRYLMAHDQY